MTGIEQTKSIRRLPGWSCDVHLEHESDVGRTNAGRGSIVISGGIPNHAGTGVGSARQVSKTVQHDLAGLRGRHIGDRKPSTDFSGCVHVKVYGPSMTLPCIVQEKEVPE